MRYTGNNCDGCKKPLLDDEDIVVCPECATPQHRDCYDENHCCVNAHLHGTDFEWKGEVNTKKIIFSSTLAKNKDKDEEDIICPHCQHNNPAGSTECKNCGMKFTMFGVNIVEAAQKEDIKLGSKPFSAQEEEPEKNDNVIPGYEAPFEIGTGEGFDAEEIKEERPEGTNPWNLGSYKDYEEINTFKGPFPVEDYTSGVRTNTLRCFVRGNSQTYINKFKWSEIKGRMGFNWSAFFFSPYWFFYRKLYKPGIIFITAQLLLSMIVTPMLTPFTEFYSYMLTLDPQTLSEEMVYELTEKMMGIMDQLMLPISVLVGVTLAMHFISGFIANGMYKKYCIRNIKEGLAKENVHEKIRHFAKSGGTSFLLVFAAYFGETLLSMLISYLMYG